MVGSLLSYKLVKKKKWDLDIQGGGTFSFTTDQSGHTIGGPKINTIVDISTTEYISKQNFLYHFSPSFTLKMSNALGISLAPHYYFDHNSNIKGQSYTEQRNSLGITAGIKYSIL